MNLKGSRVFSFNWKKTKQIINHNLHHHERGEGVGLHALGGSGAAGGGGLALVGGTAGGGDELTRLTLVGTDLATGGAASDGGLVVENHAIKSGLARTVSTASLALVGARLTSAGGNLATLDHGGGDGVGDRVGLGESAKTTGVGLLERGDGFVLLFTLGGLDEGNALGGHANNATLRVGEVSGLIHLFILYPEIFFKNPSNSSISVLL